MCKWASLFMHEMGVDSDGVDAVALRSSYHVCGRPDMQQEVLGGWWSVTTDSVNDGHSNCSDSELTKHQMVGEDSPDFPGSHVSHVYSSCWHSTCHLEKAHILRWPAYTLSSKPPSSLQGAKLDVDGENWGHGIALYQDSRGMGKVWNVQVNGWGWERIEYWKFKVKHFVNVKVQ